MKGCKKGFFLLFLLIIPTLLFGTEIPDSKNLISGELSNGVHYYIYKNQKPENRATLNLVVKTGSLLEEDNEQGIAHFLEHMAFNGTTKFKKNDMIKYLQSIGLKFGGDLNAYTTFDKTVYSLQVPTTSQELDNGIEVLREWASEVTLDANEIENEKNIIIEEWRLSQGLAQRLGDVHKKALFEGSRYYNRFPIGVPKIILGANQNLMKNFYNKWYQPQNISVVAVGDFDTKVVEEAIKKYFSYESNLPKNIPTQFKLNKLQNKYVTFSDPELRFNTFYVTKILDREIIDNEKAFKDNLIDKIIINILNSRLSNLTKENNSPFLQGFIDEYSITKDKNILDTVVIIKNNRLEEGITLINNFLKSSSINGITDTEFQLEKENIYNMFKSLVANKDSIENNVYAANLVEHIMYGESFLNVDEEFSLYKKILNEITLSEINSRLKNIYDENSLYLLTTSTQQATINEKQLQNIVVKANNTKELTNYSIVPAQLKPLTLKSGEIKNTEEIDNATVYTLSNGIKVFTKNTTFDKNKIIIKLFKKEGSSTDSYKEYINSLVAPEIIEQSGPNNLNPKDIESFMKGKNFSVNSYIDDYEQGINITSDKENLPLALEYMSQLIFYPKVDSDIFNNGIEQLKESIENRKNSPKAVYTDEIKKLYSGDNPRRVPMTLKDVNLLDKNTILEEYKEKFNNFNGYEIIMVGSLEGVDVKQLIEKYFASLPTQGKNSSPIPLDIKVPKDIVTKTVVKGVDKKATTTLIFPYNSSYGYKEKTLYNAFSQILTIALIEDIREKIGGVYSISSYTTLSPNNYGEDKLIIYYSCDTNRVNEIKNAVLETLKNLLYNKIEESKINSVVKNYELSYNTQIKENTFWVNYLYQKNTIPNYELATPEQLKEMMTSENLWEVNRKAINLNNYIDVTLIPEKESL